MIPTIKFLKKALSLCCLLIVFLFNTRLCSQIIYTDIPDATPSATYPLDLNNDSVTDFLIQFDMAYKVMCNPQHSNAYSGELISGEYLAWALPHSSPICDTLVTWFDSINPGTMAWGTSTGHWVGASDKYLALKLIVGSNTYYGWARLDILASSASFTIKDYAYQSTPNACILSGQTSLGLLENTSTNIFSIFPNPFTSSTMIKTSSHLNNATLTICNAFGQMVKQVDHISGRTIRLTREDLTAGIYFIQLAEENNIIAFDKLIIID